MNKFNLIKNRVIFPNGGASISKDNNGPLDDKYRVKTSDDNTKSFNGIQWKYRYELFPELNNVNNYLKFKFTLRSNIQQKLFVNLDYRDSTALGSVTAANLYLDAGETREYELNIPLMSVGVSKETYIVPAIYNGDSSKVDFTIYNVSFDIVEGVNLNNDLLTTLNQNLQNNDTAGIVKRSMVENETVQTANLLANKQFQGVKWRFKASQLSGYAANVIDSVATIKFAMRADFASKIYIQLNLSTTNGWVNKPQSIVDVNKNKGYYQFSIPTKDLDNVNSIDVSVFRLEALTNETHLTLSDFSIVRENNSSTTNVSDRLPHVELTGDVTKMSKDNTVTLQFKFTDHTRVVTGYSVTKWQGDSSLAYPKKNYQLKLYSDSDAKNKLKIAPFAGWQKVNKFNLKASYNDATFGRNLINSQLFAEITANRQNINSNIAAADTFATVKGLPVTVSINGSPAGLYTFNTTKDLYNMDDTNNNHIVVSGANWKDATAFKTDTALLDGTDFEIIQNSGDDADTKTKFNRLMQFINSSTDTDFVANIEKYLSLNSVYDYMAFMMMIQGEDNLGKNMTFATWDGLKWSMTAYDLDTSWSMKFDGTSLTDHNTNLFGFHDNKLFLRVSNLFKNDFKNRYNQIRNSTMTASNIIEKFENWYLLVGQENLDSDQSIWSSPSYNVTSLAQIRRDVPLRLSAVDNQISKL